MKRSSAAALTFAVIVFLVLNNYGYFFSWAISEIGDASSNSLAILRAQHFAQLYGCFSRWGFHHPGPAMFYVLGWGLWLFHDWLGVCAGPRNAESLTQLGLNVCFFVLALRLFTLWLRGSLRRSWFLAGALIFAVFHFGHERLVFFMNTWPANPPVLLMFALLTAGATVAAGIGSELPLVILSGGFLLHSHVAQPLFVLPLTLLAYLGLLMQHALLPSAAAANKEPGPLPWWRRFVRAPREAWRACPKAHLLSVGLVVIFALPLIIDVCRWNDSNLAAILHHMRSHRGEPHKGWLRSFLYFIQFGAYTYYDPKAEGFGRYDRKSMLAYVHAHTPVFACWIGVAATAAWAVIRQLGALTRSNAPAKNVPFPSPDDSRRFLAWAGVFLSVAIFITLYWGTIQDGNMAYYNASFNFGIYYFAALAALATLCAASWPRLPFLIRARTRLGLRFAPVYLVMLVCAVQAPSLSLPRDMLLEAEEVEFSQRVVEMIAATTPTDPAAFRVPKMLVFDPPDWPWGVAVAYHLARAGRPFLVSDQSRIIVGDEHTLRQANLDPTRDGVEVWRLHHEPLPPSILPLLPTVRLNGRTSLFLSVTASAEIDPGGDAALVDYRPGGNLSAYKLGGWTEPLPPGTFSDSRMAMLAFAPKPVNFKDVELRLVGCPFLFPPGGLISQRIRVFLNGDYLGNAQSLDQVATADHPVVFVIPADRWNAAQPSQRYGSAILGFEFPDARTPASFDAKGVGDQRLLGWLVESLRFRQNGPAAKDSTSVKP